MLGFSQIVTRRDKGNRYGTYMPKRLLALDPGETTGYAIFHEQELKEAGQQPTKDVGKAFLLIKRLVYDNKITDLVMEDYRIYAWKKESHTWASLHTPRLIGAIEGLCAEFEMQAHKQMAHTAKTFVNDNKLKAWDFWLPGSPHARDAIRHGCYFILFPKVTTVTSKAIEKTDQEENEPTKEGDTC